MKKTLLWAAVTAAFCVVAGILIHIEQVTDGNILNTQHAKTQTSAAISMESHPVQKTDESSKQASNISGLKAVF